MDISFIILNWNNKDLIGNCLRSVFDEIKDSNAEVIVVDNGSTDGSLEQIEKNFPQVRLIENKENLMFAKANNQGFEVAKGKWVMTLGSDTVIKKGAIKTLLNCTEREEIDPRVKPEDDKEWGNIVSDNEAISEKKKGETSLQSKNGLSSRTRLPSSGGEMSVRTEGSCGISNDEVVKNGEGESYNIIYTPQLISQEGGVLLSCRKIPTFWNLTKYFFYMLFIKRINPRSRFWGEYRMVDWDHDTERFVEQPEATCWLFRKDFIQEIGGLFDENFPLYFNDVETAIRVKNAGGKFRFIPDAKVVHFGGQSTKAWKSERLWKFREGLLLLYKMNYLKRWYNWIGYALINLATWFWVQIKNITKSQNSTYEIKK